MEKNLLLSDEERQKTKLAGATPTAVYPLRDAIERMIAVQREQMSAGEIREGTLYTPEWIALRLVDEAMEYAGGDELAKGICELTGLPANPWPGLKHSDIKRMVQGRELEARQTREISWADPGHLGDDELDFKSRLAAELSREWLESGARDEGYEERSKQQELEMRAEIETLFGRR